MTLAQILPSIKAGKTATVFSPFTKILLYVKMVNGQLQSSEDNKTFVNFLGLYSYVDEKTWELLPVTQITTVSLSFSTLVSAWNIVLSTKLGEADTSRLFRVFANALGFTDAPARAPKKKGHK